MLERARLRLELAQAAVLRAGYRALSGYERDAFIDAALFGCIQKIQSTPGIQELQVAHLCSFMVAPGQE